MFFLWLFAIFTAKNVLCVKKHWKNNFVTPKVLFPVAFCAHLSTNACTEYTCIYINDIHVCDKRGFTLKAKKCPLYAHKTSTI